VTQTFRTRGESGFEWMMPDAEKHFESWGYEVIERRKSDFLMLPK